MMRKWMLVSACLLAIFVLALPWAASALPPPGQATAEDAPASVGAPASANGWSILYSDDFEGGFPRLWDLEPESPTPTDPTWALESTRKHGGLYSAWCVGDPLSPPGPYPDDTNSWMKYGPFSLSDACAAELEFWAWYDTEVNDDKLLVGSSLDGSLFLSDSYSGVSGGWKRYRFDLSDRGGSSQVWIAFTFDSDTGLGMEGAYVDDIVLRKTDSIPNRPQLWNPGLRECTTDTTPFFDWYQPLGASYYRIQVDQDTLFESPVISDTTDNPWYEPASPLAQDNYFWRVAAVNGCGEWWSASSEFYIGPPTTAASLYEPEDGAHTCDTTPKFRWYYHYTASEYRLQVDDDPSFGSPAVNLVTTHTAHTLATPLALGTYFWRILPINGCGVGPASDVWGLTIDAPPGTPGSPSPADGAVGLSLDTDLDWVVATEAPTYTVHFGTSSPPPVYTSTITSSELELPRLSQSTDYYWRVIAGYNCGDSPGPVWHFMSNRPPHNGAVDPSSGMGAATFFTTTWTDADGWENLKQCYFHIGDSPTLPGNVTLLYNAKKNKLWMLDDDGMTWLGGHAPLSAFLIANSQAMLICPATEVTTTGPEVQVKWSISFTTAFTGDKKTGLKCKDINKAKAKGQWKGTWTVTS
jgi:hypothetical protein